MFDAHLRRPWHAQHTKTTKTTKTTIIHTHTCTNEVMYDGSLFKQCVIKVLLSLHKCARVIQVLEDMKVVSESCLVKNMCVHYTIHMYIHVYMYSPYTLYIYIYVYVYIYIHTYIHTHTSSTRSCSFDSPKGSDASRVQAQGSWILITGSPETGWQPGLHPLFLIFPFLKAEKCNSEQEVGINRRLYKYQVTNQLYRPQ